MANNGYTGDVLSVPNDYDVIEVKNLNVEPEPDRKHSMPGSRDSLFCQRDSDMEQKNKWNYTRSVLRLVVSFVNSKLNLKVLFLQCKQYLFSLNKYNMRSFIQPIFTI